LTNLAAREDIILDDNLYDWGVKAVAIRKYPNFYNWIENPESSPLNTKGLFNHS
jgi:hypothetical protein